jgi:hypothetical protein
VHGANDYSTLPSLHGILSTNAKVEAQSFGSYVRMLAWIVEHVDDVVLMTGSDRYWQVLDTCAATHPSPRKAFLRPELKAVLAKTYPRLVEIFGEPKVFRELRRRLLFGEYLQIVRAADQRALPIAGLSRALVREFFRKSRMLRRKVV